MSRTPLETFSREHLDSALSALRDELTSTHTAALASLRAEHEAAIATQRRELTANSTAPASSARAAIVAEERTRIAGILDHVEGKSRPSQARHLALKTGMSAEDAIALLAASGKEAVASKGGHRLDAIVPRPNVGADMGADIGAMSERERGAKSFAESLASVRGERPSG